MRDTVRDFLRTARQSVSVALVLMLICGFAYPCLLTGLSGVLFPWQANGSLLTVNGQTLGSEHVGQEFVSDCYLWSRPSAYHYNVYTEDENGSRFYLDGSEFAGLASGSENYAPTNPALTERVEQDLADFLEKNPTVKAEDIPTDLLTASGSGLDPHISPAAAEVQVPRIAAASGLSEEKVREIIGNNTEGKLLGIFGEETLNVLRVNLELAQEMGVC